MLILYRFLINIFSFFAPIILLLRIYKQKEDKERYREKLCVIKKKRRRGKLVWFHASSVGELLSVIPLVEKIHKNTKIKTILFTTNTLSSSKILQQKKNLKKVTHQFLPFDTNFFVKNFLNHWKPDAIFFVESEIWPNFIFNIKERNIPLILLNGRITAKSYLAWKKVSTFARKIFNSFDVCLAQNRETKKYLKYFHANKIKNLGNLKFSKTKFSPSRKQNKKIEKIFKNKNIWCASSTHYNEEELCGKIHINLKKKINNLVTIIIPRHVHRANPIIEELNNMNLKIHRHTTGNKLSKLCDVYLVDSYGETLKFYDVSKIVFLGGSLINHGGQNPIEPARLGCKIFHGSNVQNFKEVYGYLNRLNISKKINNAEDLTKHLIYELKLNKKKQYKFKRQMDYIGSQILNKTFLEIKKYL